MTSTDTVAPSLISKRGLRWAAVAALAGCVACCAAPLLLALGVGGAAVTAISSVIRPGAELVVGGGAFAAVLAFGALRRFATKPRSCATSCEATQSCCGPLRSSSDVYRSPVAAPDEPLACTADLREKTAIQAHMDDYRSAFTHLIAKERIPGGFRWTFAAEPGLREQLRTLAERENVCCRFFSFDITSRDGQLVWETRADDRAAPLVDEYFNLPERLREEPRHGHDLEHVKREFNRAGLTFTSDAKAK
jgi:hypothetical protein